jgi:hypothetical protein
MDMRSLKVGQKVTLSDALPGEISRSVVTEVTKWHVTVQVYARLDGKDGGYAVEFNYDGSVDKLYPWIDASTPCWDCPVQWGPIPGLKILSIEQERN